jgi:hypothetical protein
MNLLTSTIINITPTDISDMLGWTTSIINDLKGMWLLILGIFLGLTVLVIIVKALKGRGD